MKKLIAIFFLSCILAQSCIVLKEDRVLKRTTTAWRESPVVLRGYADTPFSGIFLTCRANGKFEHTSSGMLGSFSAGEWTSSQDTIRLMYLDHELKARGHQVAVMDRKTSTLVFEGDTTLVFARMRIMTNGL